MVAKTGYLSTYLRFSFNVKLRTNTLYNNSSSISCCFTAAFSPEIKLFNKYRLFPNMEAQGLASVLLVVFAAAFCGGINAEDVCNVHCDGRESNLAVEARAPVTVTLFSRVFTLMISDVDNMGYGMIENGNPGDGIWLDRSYDGGISWDGEGKLGDKVIPDGARETSTVMYNVDNPSKLRIGALRVCGKAGDRDDIACTSWARSTVNAAIPVDAAATAMMQFYNDEGLWKSTGWWNAANCLTALVDYSRLSGSYVYRHAIDTTFEKNKDKAYGNFTNEFIDDTLWYGLGWLGAYNLIGDQKYLEMAKVDADYAYSFKDDWCGGGLYWKTDRKSKNAIQNELFIKLAAALHNAIPGDTKYLGQAVEVWDWFKATGFINSEGLVNDGITGECKNNGDTTWSYNQGVIIGGLVELFKATQDQKYLDQARVIADAVLRSPVLTNSDGVLKEPCENNGGDCGADGPSFKGAFMRNIGELNRILADKPYSQYLRTQVESLMKPGVANSLTQFGLRFYGPFDKADAARQHSALEAFIAALP